MPISISYQNIANQASWLVKNIVKSNPTIPLTRFLGPAGTAVIGIHFPHNWLHGINIGSMVNVPAPTLLQLAKIMFYADVPAFRDACNTFDVRLFPVLDMFSRGSNFNGITYNDTIYVKTSKENNLELVVHELVHTLQWEALTPIGFLRAYIQGFVNNLDPMAADGGYKKNPAEVKAYHFENQFKARMPAKTSSVALTIRTATDEEGGIARGIVEQLMTMTPLNITAITARP